MKSRVLFGALLVVLVAALLVPAVASAKARKPADTVFTGGYVYTVKAGARAAHAVAVRGGNIVYVGSDKGAKAFVGPSTKVVKLRGKMVLPGFIDSHMHASMTVSSLYSVLLYGLPTVDDYTKAVAEFVTAHPDMDVIRGQGWSNTVVPGIGPLAADLDKVVSDKPVSIMSEDGHSYWVNSAALKLAGITGKTQDPVGGVIERLPGTKDTDPPYGTPSGTLREEPAFELVNDLLPDYTVQQYKDGFAYFQQEVAAPLGLTTVFDPLMYTGGNAVQALEEMAGAGQLTVRVRAALSLTPTDDLSTWIPAALAENAKHKHGMFKTVAAKIFADGVVEGHTAYLDKPYADALSYKGDTAYRGDPVWPQEQLKTACAALDEAGIQIHIHAIGDAATTESLNALAYAQKANGKHDWRPGITHLQLVDPKDYKRFAKLGVTAVPDPYWFIKDDYYTNLQVPYLGKKRADLEYPMQSFFDAGANVASASDYPVTLPPAPLMGIAVGVTRWDPNLVVDYPAPPNQKGILWPQERATIREMIRSFTLGGARANYLNKRTGTIKVGKSADLVVLNRNILKVNNATDLFKAHVLLTMGEGRVLYDRL
jgi:predicted amidohydrolase YtcJ